MPRHPKRPPPVGQIGEEVLVHLAKLPGATVEVGLEIQVRVPGGIPEETRRIVQEHCRTLNFDDFGFEEEQEWTPRKSDKLSGGFLRSWSLERSRQRT